MPSDQSKENFSRAVACCRYTGSARRISLAAISAFRERSRGGSVRVQKQYGQLVASGSLQRVTDGSYRSVSRVGTLN